MDRFYGGGHNSGMINDDPGPIPERWLQCPRISSKIVSDKFLAFKTPLSARFANKMEKQYHFQPDMVFSYMKMEKVTFIHQINFAEMIWTQFILEIEI